MSDFGQMDPVRKQAGVQGSLGLLLANASEPIQTGSSTFTNKAQWNGFNCLRCSGMALTVYGAVEWL